LAVISKQIKEFRCCRIPSSFGIRVALPILAECKADEREGTMSLILIFARKWNTAYRVLRYGNGFGPFDSVRYALWLARGRA
jgi:hypothetical protein